MESRDDAEELKQKKRENTIPLQQKERGLDRYGRNRAQTSDMSLLGQIMVGRGVLWGSTTLCYTDAPSIPPYQSSCFSKSSESLCQDHTQGPEWESGSVDSAGHRRLTQATSHVANTTQLWALRNPGMALIYP